MAVNKVILIGNLGNDVELRHLPDGRPVANVNIATTETWKDQDGNKNQHTEWHRLNFFGRQAEIASQYLRKGSPIYVEGQLRTRKWQDKDGNDRQTTEVRVGTFQMLGRKSDNESQGGEGYSARQNYSDAPKNTKSPAKDEGGMDDIEEDLPW